MKKQVRAALTVLLFIVGSEAVLAAQARAPKVAGQFYPEARSELLTLITDLLGRQPQPATAQKPRILIVPHAGYQYSGPVAAKGFRQLQGHAYDGVVVVGFTHRLQFEGVSVDAREAYQTPLGELPVDREAVEVLRTYPGIAYREEVHETDEHSLEVELPFLQVALGRIKCVPILMGDANFTTARQLADALAGLARSGDYLFVFSTDLSHHHPYNEAKAIDERTVSAILFETPQAVHRLFAHSQLEACGRGPLVTSLLLASKLQYPTRELLSYANSGDTAGDQSRVVGYAAIAMFDRLTPISEGWMSAEAGNALVAAARQVLEQSLAGKKSPHPMTLGRFSELSRASGLFVTLRKQGQLRGCIGRIQSNESLAQALPEVALDAALRDSRFPPVRAEELPDIRIEVSLLTPPVLLRHANELVAGRDGVILEYQGRSGVFLPQVWGETGWTRMEFLQELSSQKAGLPKDAWREATLSVFQDQAFEEPEEGGETP
jgi:AmmeMemoRadiSam system protein B/AmmeMemoRadiSam system protein A